MNHARQKTDRIHGTIYLSAFESELSSTPFFYRLHDIYQSSTVYLTFPSNRTKRYEHSLGTMALASELLFSSITNADAKVRAAFFEQLNAEFKNQYKKTLTKGYGSHYFGDGLKAFRDFVNTSKYGSAAEKQKSSDIERMIDVDIKNALSTNLLSDDALNHFSLHSTKKVLIKIVLHIPIARIKHIRSLLIENVLFISAFFKQFASWPFSMTLGILPIATL